MGTSRVSTSHMFRTSEEQIAKAREREVRSAEKASTQKEIVRPSQDPTGWTQAANIKDDISVKASIAKNARLANSVLSVTETILTQLTEFVTRAHELAIPAASESVATEQTRTALVTEVRALYDSSVRALNTRYAGRTLLGGSLTRGPAFDTAGVYQGDDNKFEIEVSKGLVVPINISAREVIQGEGMSRGVDVLEAMKRLIYGMEANDAELVRLSLPELSQSLEQLSLGRTQIGARMSEISRALNANGLERIESLEAVSKVEEADAVKAFSELTRDQAVLQAAMATTQKILTDDPTEIFFR